MSESSSDPVNILTLKWGTRYGPHYVNRLLNGVRRHLTRPFRFLCFTDDSAGLDDGIEPFPLPTLELPDRLKTTTWLKLALFGDDLAGLEGQSMFLDLDLLITDNIDCFFDYRLDNICIIHNWIERRKELFRGRPKIGNSSVFRFESGKSQHVVDQYNSERDHALANFHPPQTYLTHCIKERMEFWPEDWVRSFKRHCRPAWPLNHILTPKFPTGAKMLAFHGRPDPHSALEGYKGKRTHHSVKAVPWIADHWRDE
jgi:hypothetical protein